jgi:hypothetical protein
VRGKFKTSPQSGETENREDADLHRECRYREVKLVAELRQLDQDLDRALLELNRLSSEASAGHQMSVYRKAKRRIAKLARRFLHRG